MSNLIDLTGQQFGLWGVKMRGTDNKNGKPRWYCRCACGVERTVAGNALKSGKSRSCRKCSYKRGSGHPKYNGGNNFGSIRYCRQVLANSRKAGKARGYMPILTTPEKLMGYLAGREHVCDACGSPNKNEKINLSVDHDHGTGEIRGLLCLRCNRIAVEQQRVRQVQNYLERKTNG